MAANRILRIGPLALTTTLTTNIFNPAAAGSGTGYTPTASYAIFRHIRITNVTSGAVNFTLCIGATGATASSANSFFGFGLSVAANSYVDWYGLLRLDAADFLVGGAGTGSALTFQAEGEVGLA